MSHQLSAEEQPLAPPESAPKRDLTCLWLVAVLILYLLLCARLIAVLPLWGNVHDEPIHFGYCKYIAVFGKLPLIGGPEPTLDPRSCYLMPSPGAAVHHPPGYYFFGSLVLRLLAHTSLATQNYAVRSMSLLLGLLALLMLYRAVRVLLPDWPAAAVGVVALVALQPQWLQISSVIYVETFGAVGFAGALWMLALYAREPQKLGYLIAAGVFVAFMALTKFTLLPFCVALVLTALVVVLRSDRSARLRLGHLAAFFLSLAVAAGWWYLRNLRLYGKLMPTTDVPSQVSMLTLLFVPQGRFLYQMAFRGMWEYFWGPSDWLPPALRLPMYGLALSSWAVALVGLVVAWSRRQADLLRLSRPFLLPFLVGLAGFLFAYVRWVVTTTVVAHGEFGKFIMPVLGMLVLLFLLGVQSLFGRRAALYVVAGYVALFLLWDLLAIWNLQHVLILAHPPLPAP